MIAILDGNTADRLAKIAGMFGSNHDGERAAAALKFHNVLHSEGLTAEELLNHFCRLEGEVRLLSAKVASLSMPRVDPGIGGWMRRPPHLRHQSQAAECLTCLDVSDWERAFLNSIAASKTLSPKQSDCLERIYSRVRRAA